MANEDAADAARKVLKETLTSVARGDLKATGIERLVAALALCRLEGTQIDVDVDDLVSTLARRYE